MRTDKQPLEIPMNAAEEKKETSSEKLTALGGLCLLITVYWLSVVKPSQKKAKYRWEPVRTQSKNNWTA